MASRYGENLKRLRIRAKMTQEDLMKALKLKRQGQLSTLETGLRVPTPKLILRHAAAVRAKPWELLDGVLTDYDLLRRKERPPVLTTADLTMMRQILSLPAVRARLEQLIDLELRHDTESGRDASTAPPRPASTSREHKDPVAARATKHQSR